MVQELLLDNLNSWGNVDYNLRLKGQNNERRTSSAIAHRHIPPVRHPFDDCKVAPPRPCLIPIRDNTVTYRTTSSSAHQNFFVTKKPSQIAERFSNCRNVHYMVSSQARLDRRPTGIKRKLTSESRDKFAAPSSAEGQLEFHSTHPQLSNHTPRDKYNERVAIQTNGFGVGRLLDPYFTTSRAAYTVHPKSAANKDTVTFYTPYGYPQSKSVSSRPSVSSEIWMSIKPSIRHAAWGRENYQQEKLDNSIPRRVNWTPGAFVTETQMKFLSPQMTSCPIGSLGVTWSPNNAIRS